ncbi:MAG: ATP-binding protein, partial [Nitrosospira sp.]|nr:ATP-binding protein [Nitrosospira sp.]
GTGLGLPIVKKIVEEHNGMIQIENIQPHGARISITLPTATRTI